MSKNKLKPFRKVQQPVGQIEELPKDLKSSLPTIEEIEAELEGK